MCVERLSCREDSRGREHTAFFMALMIPYGVLGRVRELEWDFQAGVLGGEFMVKEKLVKIWQ